MEVRIGVQFASRELVVDSTQTSDEVHAAVASALAAGDGGVLELVDERGKRVLVPIAKLAYVEIGEPESRRVGFGAM